VLLRPQKNCFKVFVLYDIVAVLNEKLVLASGSFHSLDVKVLYVS